MHRKVHESDVVARLQLGSVLLAPLTISGSNLHPHDQADNNMDGFIEAEWPGHGERLRFAVEIKDRGTPQFILLAAAQARSKARPGEFPMVMVPYLSPEKIAELETEGMSAIDLCGNGVVVVPGRLQIVRTGQPNKYPDSRPLNNPYAGRSSLVARALLERPNWAAQTELVNWMHQRGAMLSLSQASKALSALEEDLIVSKSGGAISLREPARLMDELGLAWKTHLVSWYLRLPGGPESVSELSKLPGFKWAITGQSAAARYVMFSQGGPRHIAVSDASRAVAHLNATNEAVASFADIRISETQDERYYFACETDNQGLRWAGKVQTWLELQAGDARQREAAADLRTRILQGVRG